MYTQVCTRIHIYSATYEGITAIYSIVITGTIHTAVMYSYSVNGTPAIDWPWGKFIN